MVGTTVESIDNWIFVTGVIRSATTFVGKILSSPLRVDYIHEPFNPDCGMEGMTKRYRYIHPDLLSPEMARLHAATTRLFKYDITLKSSYYEDDPWHKKILKSLVGSRGPFYLRLAKINYFREAAVIKDPTGSLMTEYLYLRFKVKPVIVIRHPVSLMASFERLGWWPKVDLLLEQPSVRGQIDEGWLSKYEAYFESDELVRSCAHWYIINHLLLQWADKYEWLVIRHEDLCQRPIHVFQALYDNLDLAWSSRIKKKIEKYTRSKSAETKNNEVQNFKRDSQEIFRMRSSAISRADRTRIFEITADVASKVYSEESFGLGRSSQIKPIGNKNRLDRL